MLWSLAILTLASLIPHVFSQCQPSSSLSFAYTPTVSDGLAARVIQNRLTKPRGIKFDNATPPNLLVVEAGVGVSVLTPNAAGCAGWTKKVLVSNTGLNHGLEFDGTKLYASSDDKVFAWNYDSRTATISGSATTIITGMTNPGM